MLLYWILLPIIWVLAHILFRFEVIGRENLKAVRDGRAYVIAPNHIANLDPVLIAITIFDWKRLRILAKEELFKNPLAGWFLRGRLWRPCRQAFIKQYRPFAPPHLLFRLK